MTLHSYLYRRQVVLDVGGWDERIKFHDDRLFKLTLAIEGAAMRYLAGAFVRYRFFPRDSVSRKVELTDDVKLQNLADLSKLYATARGRLEAKGQINPCHDEILKRRRRQLVTLSEMLGAPQIVGPEAIRP